MNVSYAPNNGAPSGVDEACAQHLKLYISGNTARSSSAIHQLRSVCEKYLPGLYSLQVIDIYQDQRAARDDRIVAVPTLLKLDPNFTRRLIGDLSDLGKLKLFLGIDPNAETHL